MVRCRQRGVRKAVRLSHVLWYWKVQGLEALRSLLAIENPDRVTRQWPKECTLEVVLREGPLEAKRVYGMKGRR